MPSSFAAIGARPCICLPRKTVRNGFSLAVMTVSELTLSTRSEFLSSFNVCTAKKNIPGRESVWRSAKRSSNGTAGGSGGGGGLGRGGRFSFFFRKRGGFLLRG